MYAQTVKGIPSLYSSRTLGQALTLVHAPALLSYFLTHSSPSENGKAHLEVAFTRLNLSRNSRFRALPPVTSLGGNQFQNVLEESQLKVCVYLDEREHGEVKCRINNKSDYALCWIFCLEFRINNLEDGTSIAQTQIKILPNCPRTHEIVKKANNVEITSIVIVIIGAAQVKLKTNLRILRNFDLLSRSLT